MKNGHRANKKVIRLTTFGLAKRGNWMLKFSSTDMDTIMLLARSVLAPENVFIRFFSDEESATSFADFLVVNDFYSPDIET